MGRSGLLGKKTCVSIYIYMRERLHMYGDSLLPFRRQSRKQGSTDNKLRVAYPHAGQDTLEQICVGHMLQKEPRTIVYWAR